MHIILAFFLSFSILLAEEAEGPSFVPSISSNDSFPIVNFEGEPNAIVAGCVNVITGDYFDVQCDLVMIGGEPLTLERSYSSSDTSEGSLSFGWHFNLQGLVATDCNDDGHLLKTSFGSEMFFKRKKLNSKMFKKGFTNNSSGIVSGKTNLKNYRFSMEKLEARSCRITKGDGSYSIFKREKRKLKTDDKFYRVHFEKKSSGIEQHYEYDDKDRLSAVEMKSGNQSLQAISFDYPSKKEDKTRLTINTNDGRAVQYCFSTFKDHGKAFYLREVIRPNALNETYHYEGIDKDNRKKRRLVEKRKPDGRLLQISYFREGKYGDKEVTSSSKCFGRVQCILAPIGVDHTPLVAYSFQYNLSKRRKAGSCYVFNAHTIPTKYS